MPAVIIPSSLLLRIQLWLNEDKYIEYDFDPNGPDPSDCPHVSGIALPADLTLSIEQCEGYQKKIAQWMKEGERLNSYVPYPITESYLSTRTRLLPDGSGQLRFRADIGVLNPATGDPEPDPLPLDMQLVWDPAADEGEAIICKQHPAFKIGYPAFQSYKSGLDGFLQTIRNIMAAVP